MGVRRSHSNHFMRFWGVSLIAMVMMPALFNFNYVSGEEAQPSDEKITTPAIGEVRVKPTRVSTLVITAVIGRAEVKERAATAWQPLRPRSTVMPNYQIRTHPRSTVEAIWGPTKTAVKIAHETVIELRTDRLLVLAGRVWVCAAQRPGERIPLVVQSPNAFAVTERGWISVAQVPWGWTLVSTDKGKAVVAAQNHVVVLADHEMTFVPPGMPPESPRQVTCESVNWRTRIYLEEFVKKCHGIPPRPLRRDFLACMECILWDAGGTVPR
ncbi:MAG TPA: hypothetical protein EYP10_15520 [Armatimonadetes bacterium]|nr:hypothetical protein [Armatimonadota bacterium]